jgi:hypothetical protein
MMVWSTVQRYFTGPSMEERVREAVVGPDMASTTEPFRYRSLTSLSARGVPASVITMILRMITIIYFFIWYSTYIQADLPMS